MKNLIFIGAILFVIAALVFLGFIIYDYFNTKTVEAAPVAAAVIFIGIGIGIAYFNDRYVT